LNGEKYQYFCHPVNVTWRNERAVEIPIIKNILDRYSGKPVLELGNVLSRYYPIRHEVVDKYEKAKGVINQDIVSFSPKKKYDLIISISTLEHVGWSEKPKDKNKVYRGIRRVKELVKPKGEMVASLPIGYHPEVDKILKQADKYFTDDWYLIRLSQDNRWKQTNRSEALKRKYNQPYCNANAIAIVRFRKK